MKSKALNPVSSHKEAQDGLEFSNEQKKIVARGANKHNQLLDNRLKSINLELVQTKNKIVQNVLRSRALEKSQHRVVVAQEALKLRVLQSIYPDFLDKSQFRAIALAKDYSVKLTVTQYQYIATLSSTVSNVGLVKALYDAYEQYSDKGVKQTLDNCPIDANKLSQAIFAKIALSSSMEMMSDYETGKMYSHCLQHCEGDAADLWAHLKRRLLRRIRAVFVTSKGVQYLKDQEELSKSHFKFSAKSLLSASLPLSNTMPKNIFTAHDDTSISSKRSKVRPPGRAPRSLDPLSRMQEELEKSKAKQFKLQEQIALNLAELYTSGPGGSGSGEKSAGGGGLTLTSNNSSMGPSSSIVSHFRSLAVKKLMNVLVPKVERMLHNRLNRWMVCNKTLAIEQSAHIVGKNIAVMRLFRVIDWNIISRLSKHFCIWDRIIQRMKEREELAAAIQIQRMFRGHLSRVNVQKLISRRAAEAIQKIFRVHMAQRFARKVLRRKIQRRAVRRIEKMWISYRWRRALKKVFLYKRQNRGATNIQRVFRGHKGRRRYRYKLLKAMQEQAAVKFQACYRRFHAVIVVEKRRYDTKRRKAATAIQSLMRGYLVRKAWKVRWRRHKKCKLIQYAWWCSKARKECWRRKQNRAATIIQRVVRGKRGRLRYRHFYEEKLAYEEQVRIAKGKAILIITPIGLGYITRRRISDRMNAHLQKRQQAARRIQRILTAIYLGMKARRRVKKLRADLALLFKQNASARQIQRLVRGVLARKRTELLRQEYARLQDPSTRWPYYYKLKRQYYLTQDLYHRKKVIKIQSLVRKKQAVKIKQQKKAHRSATRIQSFLKSCYQIQHAKSVKANLLKDKSSKLNLAVVIQKIVRGFLVGIKLKKKKAVVVLKWLIKEVQVRKKINLAMENFRIRKQIEEEREIASIMIQSLVRGYLGKKYFKNAYRTLQRQKAIRVRAKRNKAALVIQCAYRCHRARLRVSKQRGLVAERERERRELEELERMIEGIHGEFMKELLVIRAQTGIRGKLARKEFAQRVEEYLIKEAKQQEVAQHHAATHIQCHIRGLLGRKRFKKLLPQLKLARKMRILCIECESKPGVRRCRQCRDQYCADCYEALHQKGKRKFHTYAVITPDARALAMAFDAIGETGEGKGGKEGRDMKGGNDGKSVKGGKAKGKGEWEEFYDNQAKAKYWFNKKTGEASWINPYK